VLKAIQVRKINPINLKQMKYPDLNRELIHMPDIFLRNMIIRMVAWSQNLLRDLQDRAHMGWKKEIGWAWKPVFRIKLFKIQAILLRILAETMLIDIFKTRYRQLIKIFQINHPN